MSSARQITALLIVTAAVSACAPVRVQKPENTVDQDVVVLLADADGSVGRATVTNLGGKVELVDARSSTKVGAGRAPAPVTLMSESDVRRLFGDAVSALPPPPRHFMLFFRFDSEELTDGSKALLKEVLKEVNERRAADVVVLGHTDTMGTRSSNFDLGLRRAHKVRSLLVATGLEWSAIDVVSHGEAELLIPTGDGVVESRNRRVEITVK